MNKHVFTFETELWLQADLDAVWDFFSQPRNLEQLTPDTFGTRLEFHDLNGFYMKKGGQITVSLAPIPGLPAVSKWHLKFEEMLDSGPNRKFIDVQTSGGFFSSWRHEHIFDKGTEKFLSSKSGTEFSAKKPGTWCRDKIEYGISLGPLSPIINEKIIVPQLAKLFTYRAEKLRELFPAENFKKS